jgi:hypothetical protein
VVTNPGGMYGSKAAPARSTSPTGTKSRTPSGCRERQGSDAQRATVDQRGAGTGQHAADRVDIGGGQKFPRATMSPSKDTGSQPKFSNVRRGEEGASNGFTAPAQELNARMIKDSGTKTAREAAFNSAVKERQKALEGAGARQFFPTAYESQKARIAKTDDNAGAETGYRAKKAQ